MTGVPLRVPKRVGGRKPLVFNIVAGDPFESRLEMRFANHASGMNLISIPTKNHREPKLHEN